jgi:flagellar protein FlbD
VTFAGLKSPGGELRLAARGNKNGESLMIALTRLNGHQVMVNSDLIEQIEETPDTVVTLTSGNRLVVRDRMDEIQQKIVDFKRRIYGPA